LLAGLASRFAAESNADSAADTKTLYEPALPATPTLDGTLRAQPESVLSVRLRSATPIDPESIWAPIGSGEPTDIEVTWQPVREGDLTDIWVIVKPTETWYLEDVIAITAGANQANGGTLESAPQRFAIGTPEAHGETLAQPTPGIDYDDGGLQDADPTVQVTRMLEAPETPADAFAESVRILPEEVYASPQRVWLPIPAGMDPAAVGIYYYLANGPDRGWHPAAAINGWLVSGSEMLLETDGQRYLGFQVRHAGIVRLGQAVPE
jgi:hypothetical protein